MYSCPKVQLGHVFSSLTPEVSNCALEKQVEVSFILLYTPSLKNDNLENKS